MPLTESQSSKKPQSEPRWAQRETSLDQCIGTKKAEWRFVSQILRHHS